MSGRVGRNPCHRLPAPITPVGRVLTHSTGCYNNSGTPTRIALSSRSPSTFPEGICRSLLTRKAIVRKQKSPDQEGISRRGVLVTRSPAPIAIGRTATNTAGASSSLHPGRLLPPSSSFPGGGVVTCRRVACHCRYYISAVSVPPPSFPVCFECGLRSAEGRGSDRWRRAALPWPPPPPRRSSHWPRSCCVLRRPPRSCLGWSTTRPRTAGRSASSSSATGDARARTTNPGSPSRYVLLRNILFYSRN